MAKNLMAVLILASTAVTLGDEEKPLKVGEVYDVEPKLGKQLVKDGIADDTPANIAYHRGDLDLYKKLIDEAAASKGKTLKTTEADLLQQQEAERKKEEEQKARDAAQVQADELLDLAELETDPAKADDFRAQAAEVMKQAGLSE